MSSQQAATIPLLSFVGVVTPSGCTHMEQSEPCLVQCSAAAVASTGPTQWALFPLLLLLVCPRLC